MDRINPLQVLAYSLGISIFLYGAYVMVLLNDTKTGQKTVTTGFLIIVATKLSEDF